MGSISEFIVVLRQIIDGRTDVIVPTADGMSGELTAVVIELQHYVLGLALAKEKAQAALQNKSDFLQNVSQELRGPLHSILSYTELCLDDLPSSLAQIRGYLNNISDNGVRLSKMVEDFALLAALEAEQQQFDFSEHRIEYCLDLAIAEIQPLFNKMGVQLDVKLHDFTGKLYADRTLIIQMLVNLLTNAVHGSKPGDVVTLSLKPYAYELDGRVFPAVMLEVADQGDDISLRDPFVIFEAIMQADVGVQNPQRLADEAGMIVAANIVRLHHGRIWMATEMPGCVTRMILPVDFRELKHHGEQPATNIEEDEYAM